MMVNGKPAMACFTPIKEGRDITVEPLRGFPVERDLIVDKSKMHDRISAIERRITPEPLEASDLDRVFDPEVCKKISGLEWCCRCLSCNAVCPVINELHDPEKFIGPAGLRAIALRYYDPNDKGDRVLQAVQNGLFKCILCGKCNEVCPADEINHVEIFTELRKAATARGLKPKKV